uniref:Uncharacterized protein n=1 Tax=Arundo donax TaxID=35708 RepID=A0A0A8ZK69_ARUDO
MFGEIHSSSSSRPPPSSSSSLNSRANAAVLHASSKNHRSRCRRHGVPHGRPRRGQGLHGGMVHVDVAPTQLRLCMPPHHGATSPPSVREPRPLQ